MSTDKKTFQQWVQQVTEKDMPVLSRTAAEISKLTEGDDSPISAICDLILQDAAMTMHVLRLTDSAYHMRRNRSNSISRALVMLGYEEVRSICLSLAVFRPLLSSKAHQELPNEMARAFHASLQAMQLAITKGIPSAEEVMIAALMHNLGEMVFWCFGKEHAEMLYQEIYANNLSPEEAQWKVIGFPLNQLTAELGKKWGLGELLQNVLIGDESSDPRIAAVKLGHRFAQAAEKGWQSEECKTVLQEIAQFTNQPIETLLPAMEQQTAEAVNMAKACGATVAAKRIPQPQAQLSAAPTASCTPNQNVAYYQPNQLLCMQILGETLSMIDSGHGLSEIINKIVTGICKGVGMDRAVFAKVSPNGRFLNIRFSHQVQPSQLQEQFSFELSRGKQHIFSRIMESQKPIWVSSDNKNELEQLLSPALFEALGTDTFFCSPVIVGGESVGILYADRALSKRPLDKEAFAGFRQLGMQLNLLLDSLGKQAKSKGQGTAAPK